MNFTWNSNRRRTYFSQTICYNKMCAGSQNISLNLPFSSQIISLQHFLIILRLSKRILHKWRIPSANYWLCIVFEVTFTAIRSMANYSFVKTSCFLIDLNSGMGLKYLNQWSDFHINTSITKLLLQHIWKRINIQRKSLSMCIACMV